MTYWFLLLLTPWIISGCFENKPKQNSLNGVFNQILTVPDSPRLIKKSVQKSVINSHEGKKYRGHFLGQSFEAIAIFNFDRHQAFQLMYNQDNTLRQLYVSKKSPYPGKLSKKIHCSEKYHPIKTREEVDDYYRAQFRVYANSRGTLGGCIDQFATHYADILMLYCPKQSAFFRFQFLSATEFSNNDYKKFISSIDCISKVH